MIFDKTFLMALLAATAAARPHAQRDGEPSSTTSTSASSTSGFATKTSSSPSASSSSSTTSGSGSVQIVNNLDTNVYLWTAGDSTGNMQTLNSGGGTYSHDWETNSNGGGMSLKMSTSTSTSSVLQFEYTVSDKTLFWDLSSIDIGSDSEFVKSGFSVTPSDSSCKSATCAAGDSNCADSYQHPDDVNTNSCSTDAQYVLTLG